MTRCGRGTDRRRAIGWELGVAVGLAASLTFGGPRSVTGQAVAHGSEVGESASTAFDAETAVGRADSVMRRADSAMRRADTAVRLAVAAAYGDGRGGVAGSRSRDGELERLLDAATELVRSARAIDPSSLEGRYLDAVLLGIRAERAGGSSKIRFAKDVWNESEAILAADSLHAGAHHLQGRLHAAVMRMSGVTRFLARTLVGGDLIASASWQSARAHMARAVDLAPDEPLFLAELNVLLAEIGEPARTRTGLERAAVTNP